MTELITQYGPYALIVLAAFFLFAAGHHVGAATAVTVKPDATKIVAPGTPNTTVLHAQDATFELPLNKTAAKSVAQLKAEADSNPALLVTKSSDPVIDERSRTRQLADDVVARNPDAALNVRQTLTESLTAVGHLDVKGDALDKILPVKVAEAVGGAPSLPPSPVDAEVAKAHDALDRAGVFGPNRLIAIAAVRAGQVTGDDVARAHPVQQEAKVPFGAVGLPSQDTTVATAAAPGQVQ